MRQKAVVALIRLQKTPHMLVRRRPNYKVVNFIDTKIINIRDEKISHIGNQNQKFISKRHKSECGTKYFRETVRSGVVRGNEIFQKHFLEAKFWSASFARESPMKSRKAPLPRLDRFHPGRQLVFDSPRNKTDGWRRSRKFSRLYKHDL